MAISTFKIRRGKKKSTIYLFVQNGREFRLRYSTNLNIPTNSIRYWNDKIGRIKNLSDIPNYEIINDKLSEIIKKVDTGIKLLYDDNKLDILNCRTLIENIISPSESDSTNKLLYEEKIKSVCKYYDWYIKYYSENISPNSKNTLRSGTQRTYKNAKAFLEKYLKARKISESDFTFNNINKDFYHDFIEFGNENGYTRNYIGSMIQKLKTIITSAYDNGNHTNTEFKQKYFSKLTEEINHPYLNLEELNEIYSLDLNDTYLNDVRDIFLIACNTGLRVGDLTTFLKNPEIKKIDNRNYIYLKQQKTGNEVYIPLNSMVQNILKKRDNHFPPFVHQNFLNEEIKRIIKRAKITEDFSIIRTVKGVKESEIKPKYKLISMHTARRSFCTNAYNQGMPPHHIMIISGHKSEKVFYNYIKATVQEKATQVAQHSFFN